MRQTFSGFEPTITDASTDSTYAICESLARRDARIRVLRNSRNLGANRNYQAVLDAARGTYFKWASSNDICGASFIEQCVNALERDPRAVLACSRTRIFETSIEQARACETDVELIEDEPASRFMTLLSTRGLNNVMNGVIRRDALTCTTTMGNYMGADVVLTAELALMGRFVLIDEPLFFRRMSRETATRLKSDREVDAHLVPGALQDR